jgi:hypothetical protein
MRRVRRKKEVIPIHRYGVSGDRGLQLKSGIPNLSLKDFVFDFRNEWKITNNSKFDTSPVTFPEEIFGTDFGRFHQFCN